MNKITVLIVATISLMSIAYSFAADRLTRQYVFQRSCTKSCHNNVKNGGELMPDSKTQKEWNHLFANNNFEILKIHKGMSLSPKKIAEKHPDLKENPWSLIKEQLETYAYDSDQPDEMLFR